MNLGWAADQTESLVSTGGVESLHSFIRTVAKVTDVYSTPTGEQGHMHSA